MQTRAYRVALMVANGAAALLLLIDRFGPGVGLTSFDVGILDVILNGVIVTARQILDPSTSTISKGPVALPEAGTAGPQTPTGTP